MSTINNIQKIGKVCVSVNVSEEPLESETVYANLDMTFETNNENEVTILEMCDIDDLDNLNYSAINEYLDDKEFISEVIEDAGIKDMVSLDKFTDALYEALNAVDMGYTKCEGVVYGSGYGVGSECLDQPEYPAMFAEANEEYAEFDMFVDENGNITINKK